MTNTQTIPKFKDVHDEGINGPLGESSIGELRSDVARQGDAIGELSDNVARQGDAIGELRGNVARQVAGVHFLEISDGMGFQFKGLLTRLDLGQMIFQRETDDIPQSDRRSFFRADSTKSSH